MFRPFHKDMPENGTRIGEAWNVKFLVQDGQLRAENNGGQGATFRWDDFITALRQTYGGGEPSIQSIEGHTYRFRTNGNSLYIDCDEVSGRTREYFYEFTFDSEGLFGIFQDYL